MAKFWNPTGRRGLADPPTSPTGTPSTRPHAPGLPPGSRLLGPRVAELEELSEGERGEGTGNQTGESESLPISPRNSARPYTTSLSASHNCSDGDREPT
jgi:hypothetical protein